MQMYAPPGVNAVTSATTGQPYTVAPGGAINALVQDVPDLLSRGFTLQRTPFVLAQSGTPVILPSSGSSNASGQITLTTALPYTPVGTVGVYLPAGVVTAGSQGSGAGVYQATFSSTTVCQLVGTGIVTANGAYTQTTSAVVLASVAVPGGSMGPNGKLRVTQKWSYPNNANTKVAQNLIGGANFAQYNATSTLTFAGTSSFQNRGTQAANFGLGSNATVSFADMGGQASGLSFTYHAIDTSVTQPLTLTGWLNVSALDYMILEGYTIEVLPG